MTQIAAPKPVFDGVKEWPAPPPNPVIDRHHNQPPPEEMVVIEFNEALDRKDGFRAKFAALVEKGKSPPDCNDDDMAGRLGDFIKMASNAQGFIDEQRTAIKAPYLAAGRAIDGVARAMAEQLDDAKRAAKAKLDTYMAEKARLQREEAKRIADELDRQRRQAEEHAAEARLERALAAQDGAESPTAPPPEPLPPPAPVATIPKYEPPVARGDLGSRVGIKVEWKHRIDSVRQLPDALLKHPKVIEALDGVVKAQIRGGAREIKGCTIWPENVSSVR
jgi:polyhydroxyalkanoate synthesis regulator phasin